MIASRVGVLPPGWVPLIEAVIAAPFIGADRTTGAIAGVAGVVVGEVLEPPVDGHVGRLTTFPSAIVSCDHFELAPQPPLQAGSLSSSFIDADLSWTMRMSGGSGMTGVVGLAAGHPSRRFRS